jgi:hypothetical protein
MTSLIVLWLLKIRSLVSSLSKGRIALMILVLPHFLYQAECEFCGLIRSSSQCSKLLRGQESHGPIG